MNSEGQKSREIPRGVTIRPFRDADLSFVIEGQLRLYASEHGFTSATWREYLTGGVQSFAGRFDGDRDCMFILEYRGVPSGCVAIIRAGDAIAQLRFFFLLPEARGIGAGRRLLGMAVDFCREKEYRQVFLWTFETLMPARHLYASIGFRVTETRENLEWGTPIREERWDLFL